MASGSRGASTLSGKKGNIIDEEFLKSHLHLVLDTKFFPQEFKDRLLSAFDDLEEATSGLMVKSENWQALNLLQERYTEQVKCILHRPAINTGNDDFLYKDNYQHSSWLAMMGDRLNLSKKIMAQNSAIFTSIDDNEHNNLDLLFNLIFESQNFITNIIWQKRVSPANDAKWFRY